MDTGARFGELIQIDSPTDLFEGYQILGDGRVKLPLNGVGLWSLHVDEDDWAEWRQHSRTARQLRQVPYEPRYQYRPQSGEKAQAD